MKLLLVIASLLISVAAAADYMFTDNVYPPQADKDALCKLIFGDTAQVADFEDFQGMTVDEVDNLMIDMHLSVSRNVGHYFVNVNGQSLFAGTHKHAYFFENHGGDPPSFFDTVEKHAGLTVGVTNKFGHIVCRLGEGSARRSLKESVAEPEFESAEAAGKVEDRKPADDKKWWGW